MTACFSILANGTHLDAIIISMYIFRSSSIDVIIFNCGPLIMDASLVVDDFFGTSRILAIIKGLNSRSLWSSFGWSTKRNFLEDQALSIGPFQNVKWSLLLYSKKKWKAAINCTNIIAYTVKIVKFLERINSEHP